MAAKRFSPSAAWDDVRARLVANRQLLIALGGAFFLLPCLIFFFFSAPLERLAALGPEPAPQEVSAIGQQLLPWMLFLVVAFWAGQLAILGGVMLGEGRAAKQAIATALSRFGYLGLVNILVAAALLLLDTVLGLAGFWGVLVAFAVQIYIQVRLTVVAPVLVAEQARWPISVVRRSWEITSGNFFRMFAFYLLVVVLTTLLIFVALLIVGVLLVLTGLGGEGGGSPNPILMTVLALGLTTLMVLSVLMSLAIYRQLAEGRTATLPHAHR
ncbi:MAG: hypothetical protein ABR601_02300 [Parasphingopyxis sp.]|nr:hypothetical protein [Sphingomonadales bacterium]